MSVRESRDVNRVRRLARGERRINICGVYSGADRDASRVRRSGGRTANGTGEAAGTIFFAHPATRCRMEQAVSRDWGSRTGIRDIHSGLRRENPNPGFDVPETLRGTNGTSARNPA